MRPRGACPTRSPRHVASHVPFAYSACMRWTSSATAPAQTGEALHLVERMMREGIGLRLLLAKLPPGATLDDARRLRERLLQRGRKPSRVLDAACGIERA